MFLPSSGCEIPQHRLCLACWVLPRPVPAGFAISELHWARCCQTAGVTRPHAGLSPLHRKAARGFPLGAHPGETEMKMDGDMGRFVWCCAGTWEVTVPASHLDFCSAVTLCPRSCPTTPPSPIFAVTVEPAALPGSSWAQTPSAHATRVGVISM